MDELATKDSILAKRVDGGAASKAAYKTSVQRSAPLSKKEVKEQLDSTADKIASRLAALQDEVVETGKSVLDVTENPMVKIGGALAAGLVVGLLFGKSRRSKSAAREIPKEISELLIRKAASAVEAGDDPVDAVHGSLQNLMPTRSAAPIRQKGSSLGGLIVSSIVRYGLANASTLLAGYLDSKSASDTEHS